MEESLVPANALRPRALGWLLLGFGALTLLTASDTHFALSVPLGLLAALLGGFGALDFLGCFEPAPHAAVIAWDSARLRPLVLQALGGAALWLLALRLAVAGELPGHAWLAPLLVSASSLGGVVTLGRLTVLWAAPGTRLREHPGFWLVLLGTALYVPLLGSYSLLDPWETHYAEVTREMLARDDWISLWWAHEGWFWSKPVLDFWMQGLCFALLGVKFAPDRVLAAAAHGALPQPEWAARLPVVLLTLLSVLALYRCVAAAAGKRAGFFSGLVLLCAPYWSLLSHQSMTDMPYVAPLTTALSLFGLGVSADPDELAPALELPLGRRRLQLSAFHLLFGLLLLVSLPQLGYLISRNLTLQLAAPPYGFRWHLDEFFSGSGLGNCGLPGNEACRGASPQNPLFQPLLGALIFGAALGYLLYLNRGERRKKRLYYLGAWLFTALSALAKGAPGFVLPVVIAAAVVAARRDFRELERLELAGLGLTLAAVCLPWYVQAYMRHGEGFTDRLLFHDMYARAFVHVHDTNAGTDVSLRYYVWQLGYGLFPWTGLLLPGLGVTLAQGSSRDLGRRDLGILITLWFCVAFCLFTLSLTKFHHYALPCAPPLAVAAALLLERAFGSTRAAPEASDAEPPFGVLAIAAALGSLLVARDLSTSVDGDVPASARLLHLVTYNYKRSWPDHLDFEAVAWGFGVASALCFGCWLWRRARRYAALGALALGVWFCAFTLWVYLPSLAPHFGQRELMLAYYRARHDSREPIVAYQMNWKGENFYTGNRLAAFVSTGAKFGKWLKRQRKAGVKVMFFVTEHGRYGTLRSELGDGFRLTRLTDRRLNDKFELVRAELLPEPGAGAPSSGE